MASNLYRQTIPGYVKYLKNLSHLLKKTTDFCQETSKEAEDILQFKLYESHPGIPYHVQLCSNIAKHTAFRLSGIEMPVFEDNETTFEQLQERIKLTIEALEKFPPSSMACQEDKELFITTQRFGEIIFDSKQRYVAEYALPHFFFHLTSIYCTLNYLGVPVGFTDYFDGVFVPVGDVSSS